MGTEKLDQLESIRAKIKTIEGRLPAGSCARVSKKLGISQDGLYKIRDGDRRTVNNQRNRAYLRLILKAFQTDLKEQLEKLTSL